MDSITDLFDFDFEVEYMLFVDELENSAGIYVVHTEKEILDAGETEDLKEAIESHPHTKSWIDKAQKGDIYIAFHSDPDPESRKDKLLYIQSKIIPQVR